MKCLKYDMVVVGAGPAGASAARAASLHGIATLLIDARKNPGSPVQCAEYVPLAVKKYVSLEPKAVVQKIDTLRTFINDQLVSTLAGPGYMLDRVVFDGSLVQRAREAGAEFWPDAKAIGRTDEGLIVLRTGPENVEIKCRIIIGADGPRSTVGRWMNSENNKFMVGLQYNLPLCKYQSSTDIYFQPEYEGGYAWVFPKGENANVGIGVNLLYKNKLQFLVTDFIEGLVAQGILADSRPTVKTGGLIPVGGPLAVTQKENMLLAGDAAGHTHPVTGGGIMNAIVTGQMAGELAAQAVINHDLKLLSHYPRQWQSLLGRYLERAAQQRSDMDHNWTYNPQHFETLIRRTWISFN